MLTARDLIPPVAIKAAKKLFGPNGNGGHAPVRYASYAAALKECSRGGYENPDIVGVVCEKTKRLRDQLQHGGQITMPSTQSYTMTALLAALNGPEIRVLDFGGACGHAYFMARRLLPPTIRLQWDVVETPEMVRAGSSMATSGLSFTSDLASVQHRGWIDLIHTSGALQYTPDPLGTLRALMDMSAPYILLSRLALSKGSEVVSIQESRLADNGPGLMPEGFTDQLVRYPFVYPSESEFYRILESRYDIAVKFDDNSGRLNVAGEEIVGGALLAKCRE